MELGFLAWNRANSIQFQLLSPRSLLSESRLDVEQPFTVRVLDPQGISDFKPRGGVACCTWDPASGQMSQA